MFEGLLIALLVVGLMAGTAFAGKPTGGATAGNCSASPSPVPLGAEYSINGSGLRAGEVINVYIHDSVGTSVKSTAADGSGRWSVTSWASNVGMSNVNVVDMWARHAKTVASCSFQVN